jgi:hypothetical protein
MDAITLQLSAMQQQLSDLAKSHTALLATQSVQGAALAVLAAAVKSNVYAEQQTPEQQLTTHHR